MKLVVRDEKDVTVRGLEAIKSCDKVFLECYTSILSIQKEKLEEYYGKEVIIADRDFVECQAEDIYTDSLPRRAMSQCWLSAIPYVPPRIRIL